MLNPKQQYKPGDKVIIIYNPACDALAYKKTRGTVIELFSYPEHTAAEIEFINPETGEKKTQMLATKNTIPETSEALNNMAQELHNEMTEIHKLIEDLG